MTQIYKDYMNILMSLSDKQLRAKIPPKELLMAEEGKIATYYAPFDYVNPSAKIVIVGITPGRQQMDNANLATAKFLAKGNSPAESVRLAKSYASFSGPMRSNLVKMLNYMGLNENLKVGSADTIFEKECLVAHFTSLLRYPVFYNQGNYNGQVKIKNSKLLNSHFEQFFTKEVEQLPDAIYLPLGEFAEYGLSQLINSGVLFDDQVLFGFPHPSPANNERINYFLRDKPKSLLSNRTNAKKIDDAKAGLVHKIKRLI